MCNLTLCTNRSFTLNVIRKLSRNICCCAWLFLILLLASFSNGHAQTEAYDPSKIIPPSPTAASLGVYGNYNVGYYTGRPEISIPLYEIKTANHVLPIVVQYDASGIRASQQASWVGLSWSLSAGGVITRTIRGLDDFTSGGYYTAEALPVGVTFENKPYFDAISNGTKDAETDVFHYNVGPYSGKFVMGKQADGSIIFMDQANNLLIQYVLNDQRWELIDGKGYKYFFSTPENVVETYNYSGGSELNDKAPLSQYEYSILSTPTTSWYLDSIASPTSETIKFIYETGSYSISLVQKSEREYNLLELRGFTCLAASPRFPGSHKTYNSSRQVTQDRYLKKVLFQNGSIEFIRTDRNDIEFKGNEKPDKLSEIVIRDSENNLIKAFEFHHSYFVDGEMGRLKLDSLTEFDKYGNKKPPHRFSYFTSDLPNPYTKSIDHWGFYNGSNNNTLLPEYALEHGSPGDFLFFDGGDRAADTSIVNAKRGVLSSISYPTGGLTQFDYELHEYGNPRGSDSFIQQPAGEYAFAMPGNQWDYASDTVTLDASTQIKFEYDYSPAEENPTNYFSTETQYAYILNESGGTLYSFNNFDCPGQTAPCTEGTSTITLPAGTYIFKVEYYSGWQTALNSTWKRRIPVTKKKGGGIRLKSILNIENNKEANFKKFIYTTNLQSEGATTGKLISEPSYAYTFTIEDGTLWDCPPYFGDYLCRTSSSIAASGLTSASTIVGYDIVTEVIGKDGEGGKIEHTFINVEDQQSPFPYLPPYSSPLNGKLKQTVTANDQGDALSKVEYDYTVKEFELLRGIKLYQEQFPEIQSNYQIKDFYDYTSWVVQAWEKRTDNMDTQPIVTLKSFYYENNEHKALTRLISTNSDGTKVVTKYKYPGDYAEAGSGSFVRQMKERNIVTPVIEEQTLLDRGGVSKLISGTFTKYKLVDSRFYKPESIFRLSNTEALADTTLSNVSGSNQLSIHPSYREEIVFDEYSKDGNLESFHKANGESQSYIWDYKSSLPVAHVINAFSSDVAYTSFESDGSGGWDFNGVVETASNTNILPTGKRFYDLTPTTEITKSGLTTGRRYVISYWSMNGPFSVEGGSAPEPVKTHSSINGWTYFEHSIVTTGTTLTITGTGSIDEVRLFPANSQMSTYTYEPLIGLTNLTDNNGVVTYFEYDGFHRLKSVKDQYGNVLKRHHYHYATNVSQQ